MSTIELNDAIKTLAESIKADEKFATPILAAKACQAAQANPHDASLVTASNVLKKMASTQLFISRSELNDLYDKLYSPNSKLAEVFEEELDRKPLNSPKMFERSDMEERPLTHDYSKITDPLLSNALMAAMDGSNEAKLYSGKMAKKAEESCLFGLKSLSVTPKKIDVFAGRDNFILCQAIYETPKGEAHVLVPVELNEDKALIPTMFLTEAGFADLTKSALEKHLVNTAGKAFKVDGQQLLDVLASVKDGVYEPVTDVDVAVMKLNAQSETPVYTENGILYKEVETPTMVKDPEYEKTAEHDELSRRLLSPSGLARQILSDSVVDAALSMVKRKLNSLGFRNVQVSVADVEEDSISIAVDVNRQGGVKVALKIENGLVHSPKLAFANGKVEAFTAQGISRLISKAGDPRMSAVASPMYGMKPSELMQQVMDGIAEGNLLKAEDAIGVLGEVDKAMQKRAFDLFTDSFDAENIVRTASEHTGCTRMITNSTSNHPICGHLNLPLHKIYQDKFGNCQPLYRKNAEEDNNNGALFMTHKVFI